jgi:hypothetical protein
MAKKSWIVAALMIAVCVFTSGGAPVPVEQFEFVPNTARTVGFRRGGDMHFGTLDAAGNFQEQGRHQVFKPTSASVPNYTLIGAAPGRPVYEFRFGRLIKGAMDKSGNFIPEAGSVVLRFEDYRYSPTAIPIWNLPGYFKKKDPADAKK